MGAVVELEDARGRVLASGPCDMRWNAARGIFVARGEFPGRVVKKLSAVVYRIGAKFVHRHSVPPVTVLPLGSVAFELPITLYDTSGVADV